MDFLKRLKAVVTGLAPILGAVAAVFCPGVAIAPLVLSKLPDLIGLAESVVGAGNGPIKKEYVMNGAQAIVTMAQAVSTGGQAATWEQIAPLTSTLVDAIVAGTKVVGVEWDDTNSQLSAG